MAEKGKMVCQICDAPSDGMHFGIEACRACAAFFRRTVNLKRGYMCRSGTGDCVISVSIRNICRSCRFQKCLKCGMLTENVQPKRDSLKNSFDQSKFEAYSPVQSASSSNDVDMESDPQEEDLPRKCLSSAPGSVSPDGSSSYLVTVSTPAKDIIGRIGMGLVQLREARFKAELELKAGLEFTNINEDPDGIYLSKWEHSLATYRASIPLIGEFVVSTFEEFNTLPREEKIPEEGARKMMLSPRMCVDLDHADGFFGSSVAPALARLLKEVFEWQTAAVETVRSLKITDGEFAALVALTLFAEGISSVLVADPDDRFHKTSEMGIDEAAPKTQLLIRRMREEIFNGLHYYYLDKLCLNDYACRMGEAMDILRLVQKSERRVKAKTEAAEALGIYNFVETVYANFDFPLF